MIHGLLLVVLAVAGPEGSSGPSPDDRAERLVAEHATADRLLVAGELEAAGRSLQACLRIDQGLGAAHYGLACVASRQGRLDDAWSHLEAAAAQGWYEFEMACWDPDLAALIEADVDRVEQTVDASQGRLLHERLRPTWKSTGWKVSRRSPSRGRMVLQGEQVGWMPDTTGGPLLPLTLDPDRMWRLQAWAGSSRGRILAAMEDSVLHLWDLGTGEHTERKVFEFPESSIRPWLRCRSALAWDRDGEILALQGKDGRFQFRTRAGDRIGEGEAPLATGGACIQWWGNRAIVAEGSALRIVDPAGKGSPDGTIECGEPIATFDVDPTGRRVATGHVESVRVWKLTTGELEYEFEQDVRTWWQQDPESVTLLAFDPGGERLASGYDRAGSIVVHSLAAEPRWESPYLPSMHDGDFVRFKWGVERWAAEAHLIYGTSTSGDFIEFFTRSEAEETNASPGSVVRRKHPVWWHDEGPNGFLLVSSKGWYSGTGSPDDVDFHFRHQRVRCEYRRSERLFDPKRVRALLSGVRVRPPPLR